jgi:hypothetical protein
MVVRRDEDASSERRADERGQNGECSEAFQVNLQSFYVEITLAAKRMNDCQRL